MSKTLVNGTAYDIKGGRCLVNGTSYSIKKGRTLVNGTGYDISFGTPISALPIGESVHDSDNNYYKIIQHGRPDVSQLNSAYKDAYSGSENGTFLMLASGTAHSIHSSSFEDYCFGAHYSAYWDVDNDDEYTQDCNARNALWLDTYYENGGFILADEIRAKALEVKVYMYGWFTAGQYTINHVVHGETWCGFLPSITEIGLKRPTSLADDDVGAYDYAVPFEYFNGNYTKVLTTDNAESWTRDSTLEGEAYYTFLRNSFNTLYSSVCCDGKKYAKSKMDCQIICLRNDTKVNDDLLLIP